jgi:hypothetical protein
MASLFMGVTAILHALVRGLKKENGGLRKL